MLRHRCYGTENDYFTYASYAWDATDTGAAAPTVVTFDVAIARWITLVDFVVIINVGFSGVVSDTATIGVGV